MAGEKIIHVVDDDRRFLAALERSLCSMGLAVRAYASARAFLSQFEPDQPGCLITDLRMPDIDGITLQKTLRERKIRIPIIFITGHGQASTAVAALKGGAVDFLEKPFSEQALLDSVALALDKDSADRAITGEKTVVKQRFTNLTPREQEVFALVVSDLPNKEIARQLKISPRTVEHHREHVMLKMQAESISELITMAVLCGMHELHL